MVKVKVCGITNEADARAAVEAGADALGFVFHPKSPRRIEPARAREIVAALPPFVVTVGVFVDMPPEEVARVMAEAGLTLPQFHGAEPPEVCRAFPRVIKAIRVAGAGDLAAMGEYAVSAFLLDAYVPGTPGGTGRSFDWGLAREAAARGRVILAGGLTPENVAEAVRLVQPYGVDVSSGVERSPGVKDDALVRAFVERAKAAC